MLVTAFVPRTVKGMLFFASKSTRLSELSWSKRKFEVFGLELAMPIMPGAGSKLSTTRISTNHLSRHKLGRLENQHQFIRLCNTLTEGVKSVRLRNRFTNIHVRGIIHQWTDTAGSNSWIDVITPLACFSQILLLYRILEM